MINERGVLLFDEGSHSYYFNGEKCISVTTLIGMFQREFPAKVVAQRIAEKEGRTAEMVLYDWNKLKQDAIDNGTKVHNDLEAFIKYGHIYNEELINNFAELIDTNQIKIFEYIYSEVREVLPEYRVAGTFDLMTVSDDGDFVLYDFKTGKVDDTSYGSMLHPISHLKDNKINKYSIQLEIYRRMIAQHGYNCVGMNIIWVKDDYSMELIDTKDMEYEVSLLLEYWNENDNNCGLDFPENLSRYL